MSMYERFARDASESLFTSIYRELYALAEHQQSELWAASKRRRRGRTPYGIGEHQEALNAFCHNRLSIGEALDHLNIAKAYALAKI